MKTLVRALISAGVGVAVDFFRREKPLRKWLAKRKRPPVDPVRADELAEEGLQRALDEAERLDGKDKP